MDNQFLMLCHKYEAKRMGLIGNLISEKLDGQRGFWDGGITAGMRVKDIPWANKYDARKQDFLSTGLWSRYGSVVHAPDSWLKNMPSGILLDGELFAGYEHRQYLMSTIKKEDGSTDWSRVQYVVYDTPPAKRIFSERTVTYSGRKQLISGAMPFCDKMASVSYGAGFKSRYEWIKMHVTENDIVRIHTQHEIPYGYSAKQYVDALLSEVLAKNGEGLVIKGRDSLYECARSYGCLKMKPFDDGEGTVVGWIAGEETDKGSRLLGKMGSLILRLDNGKELCLSGFTDAERELSPFSSEWARNNPGKELRKEPTLFDRGPVHFRHGQVITYKYRGLTADGIPMEARFWRERSDE